VLSVLSVRQLLWVQTQRLVLALVLPLVLVRAAAARPVREQALVLVFPNRPQSG
jgi:hypothetical protein